MRLVNHSAALFDMEQPPIRILRRPCPLPSDVQKTPQRPPVFTKTLEQREADYAAARRRIMGSATPEPNEVGVRDSVESNSMSIPEDINNVTSEQDLCIETTSSAMRDSEVSVHSDSTSDLKINHLHTSQDEAQFPAPQDNKQLLEVGVSRKLQQHPQCLSNGIRQNMLTQRSATVSANRLSYFPQPPLFSFQTGYNNVGLLPTPPGFQCSLQNGTNAGLQQTAAIALMHQLNLLQQQYQQTLTGIQKQLVTPGTHSSTSFNPLNFSSLPHPNISHKYTHPPTFN